MQIAVKDVKYIYSPNTPFEKLALRDINFQVPQGTYTAIVGKTGSGKSTLIQLLSGLLIPSSGTIQIGDVIVDEKSKNLQPLRKQVGMVFQYPEHQLFAETVEKDVAFGPTNQGLSAEEIRERVYESLEQVQLPKQLWTRSPFQLSGGQMRRVAIAGILAMKPKVLLLDEPTAGLDSQTREHLLKLIATLYKEAGLTVIHVTHDMEEAAVYADQIIVLSEGRIAMADSPTEIFSNKEQLLQIGLDIPRALQWVDRINRYLDRPLPKTIFTVDQMAEAIASRWKERNG